MFSKFFRQLVAGNNYQLFDNRYIDPKGLFMHFFHEVPSVSYITDLDIREAYPFLLNQVTAEMIDMYQHAQFSYEADQMECHISYLVLQGSRLIETGNDYIAVFHTRQQADWTVRLMRNLAVFRTSRQQPNKIGFHVQNN